MPDALDPAAEHAQLVEQLRAAGTPYFGGDQNDSYTGSGRPFFCVSVPNVRRIARTWLAAHRTADPAVLLAVVDRLFAGLHYEEKVVAAVMLGYSRAARAFATPAKVDAWLHDLNGWAEIDSLCASVFPAAEMAADWPAWFELIDRLSRDRANVNRRRAALVLLCTPTRTSDDPRFTELAFEVIGRLAPERPILITKAVSWLLRSLATRRPAEVAAYLGAHQATLPAIAVRETRKKIESGTKSGKPAKIRRAAAGV
jgi:3-methyladenine DNA glycosylase AlkD